MFTPFVYYVVLNTDNQTIKRLRLVRVSCNLSTVFIYHTCYIYSNLVNLTIHYQTLYDTVCTHAFMHYHPLYMLDNIILQLFMFREFRVCLESILLNCTFQIHEKQWFPLKLICIQICFKVHLKYTFTNFE